jgi:hypothetical protein
MKQDIAVGIPAHGGHHLGIMTSLLVPEMPATNAPTIQTPLSISLDIIEKLRV